MEMNHSLLSEDEVARAQNGPRELKLPTSREYAIQTVKHLARMLSSLKYDEDHVRKELDKIEQYRHWEVLGYSTREALLDAELGDLSPLAKERLQEAKAAVDRAREEVLTVSAVGGRPPKAPEITVSDNTYGSRDSERNSQSGALRRLARMEAAGDDRARDLLQRVERGEITANKAAREAGIRKPPKHPPVYLANDMAKVAQILKRRYSASELQRLVELLCT